LPLLKFQSSYIIYKNRSACHPGNLIAARSVAYEAQSRLQNGSDSQSVHNKIQFLFVIM